MQCGRWNNDESNCNNCGNLIDPILIEEEREKVREEVRNSIPPSKVDVFLLSWKNSRFFALRILYTIIYSIVVGFLAIASFFAYLAAAPNG